LPSVEGHVPTTSATTGERGHQGLFERVENSFCCRRRRGASSGWEHEPLPLRRHCTAPRRRLLSSAAPTRTAGHRLARDFGRAAASGESSGAACICFVYFTSAPPAPFLRSAPPLRAFRPMFYKRPCRYGLPRRARFDHTGLMEPPFRRSALGFCL
jgi:hypothetical protein